MLIETFRSDTSKRVATACAQLRCSCQKIVRPIQVQKFNSSQKLRNDVEMTALNPQRELFILAMVHDKCFIQELIVPYMLS